MTANNPLLSENPIEHIDTIQPDHIEPAIAEIISENELAIKTLLDSTDLSTDSPNKPNSITWDNFMLPMEKLENRLEKAWSPISHLNSVCNSDELRQAYDKALALLTDYSTKMGQNKALFEATEKLYNYGKESNSFIETSLTETQRHILKDSLIGFKLSGLHLNPTNQKTFSDIQSRLAEIQSKFSQNLMDATMNWKKHITNKDDLAGLPDNELSMLAANAKSQDKEGYLISLEIPSYLAVMTYADNRELRQEVYTAYTTRASEVGPDNGKFDNSAIMQEILKLKYEKATLLGFDNYAQLSLESKMAKNSQQVIDFLMQLNESSQQQATQEFETLKAFAKQQGVDDFQAWDASYYSEKLKQQNYQISESELRPYFPAERVIQGLFDITSHHFNVTFEEIKGSALWHQDVKHFMIKRDGEKIAEFYFDLYARPHKRGGAWMADYQGRFKLSSENTLNDNSRIQIPIAFLTCNFAGPTEDKPALLTHDQVVTLFHEFGHGLHHMLTQVNELSASGIANVPWDAVELPSQFMENFCYQPEVIKKMSAHYQSGEPLPQDMLDKLIAAKNFQSAMMMLRQLEFALFDMHIHSQSPLSSKQIQQALDDIRAKVAVSTPPEFNRFQHGFSHIFAGGYSAGYYSYKWAEVLSADAFSLFEEEGIMNQETGKKFLETILEKGGSREPMELFVALRGREPKVEPLLRHSGIK
jgi:oligopeptidase A